jgi:hypothetical protein
MLDRLDAVRWDELRDLVGESYEMVAAKAPAKAAKRKSKNSPARAKKSRKFKNAKKP